MQRLQDRFVPGRVFDSNSKGERTDVAAHVCDIAQENSRMSACSITCAAVGWDGVEVKHQEVGFPWHNFVEAEAVQAFPHFSSQ